MHCFLFAAVNVRTVMVSVIIKYIYALYTVGFFHRYKILQMRAIMRVDLSSGLLFYARLQSSILYAIYTDQMLLCVKFIRVYLMFCPLPAVSSVHKK